MASKKAQIQVSLTGAKQASSQATGVSGALDKMRRSALAAGRAGSDGSGGMNRLSRSILSVDTANGRLSHSLGLTSKAMKTVKYGAVALTGAGTAFAASWIRGGVKLNDNFRTLVARMGVLTGSVKTADKALSDIRDNNKSPMRFTVQAEAASSLAASNMDPSRIPKLITALSNTAMTASGDMEQNMSQLGEIFAQVQARGRLTGESVDRIQSMGIDVLGVLKEQFDLSGDQLTKIADQKITADKFMAAWTKHGTKGPIAQAAAVMAETPDGIHRNMVKNWEKLQRVTTAKIADLGTGIKAKVRDALGDAGDALDKGGFDAMIGSLDTSAGASGRVVAAWGQIKAISHSFGQVIQTVLVPALVLVWDVLKDLPNPLEVLNGVMKFAAKHAETLKVVLAALVVGYVAYRVVGLAVKVLQVALIVQTKLLAGARKVGTAAIWAQIYAESAGTKVRKVAALSMAKLRGLHLVTRVQLLALTIATKAQTVAQFALNMVMRANPIVLVVTAIAALAAGLVLAYRKIGWFRTAVNAAWGALKAGWAWIKANWPLVLSILTGPIGAAVIFIVRHWDKIKSAASSVVNFVKTKFGEFIGFFTGLPGKMAGKFTGMFDGIKEALRSALNWVIDRINGFEITLPTVKVLGKNVIPGGGEKIGFPDMPRIATGGEISSAGWHWVGERGPELMRSEPGTQVVDHRTAARVTQRGPVAGAAALAGGVAAGPEMVELHTHIHADGREFALIVDRHRLRTAATA